MVRNHTPALGVTLVNGRLIRGIVVCFMREGVPVNLRHLRYFVKIVEAGSFSRAAATIHVAQPALSQQIAELEAELGVRLLLRTPRGVHPTPAGEVLCREAAAILRQMERLPGLVRSTGGDPEGAVSLGMTFQLTGSYSGAIDACRAMLPKVNLSFISEGVVRLKSQISVGLLDMAVTFDDEEVPGLTFRPLFPVAQQAAVGVHGRQAFD